MSNDCAASTVHVSNAKRECPARKLAAAIDQHAIFHPTANRYWARRMPTSRDIGNMGLALLQSLW
jgi:hypothetical protein